MFLLSLFKLPGGQKQTRAGIIVCRRDGQNSSHGETKSSPKEHKQHNLSVRCLAAPMLASGEWHNRWTRQGQHHKLNGKWVSSFFFSSTQPMMWWVEGLRCGLFWGQLLPSCKKLQALRGIFMGSVRYKCGKQRLPAHLYHILDLTSSSVAYSHSRGETFLVF